MAGLAQTWVHCLGRKFATWAGFILGFIQALGAERAEDTFAHHLLGQLPAQSQDGDSGHPGQPVFWPSEPTAGLFCLQLSL